MATSFQESLVKWIHRIVPPSNADLHWRHEYIVDRLAEIETAVSHRLQRTLGSAEQQAEILAVLRLLEPKSVLEFEKTRVGSNGDGGYVQLADYEGLSHALSFGVSDNDDWDLAMARAGIAVDQFDYSIEDAPSKHPLLQFHRKKISVEARPDTATLPDLVRRHSTMDGPDLILKIDIEGCEWEVFNDASEQTLSKFRQIICEFHDLCRLDEKKTRDLYFKVFEKLNKGFEVIHVHGNNHSRICNVANVVVPDALEITFASRARYAFRANEETFPTRLDRANIANAPDIVLGMFRF